MWAALSQDSFSNLRLLFSGRIRNGTTCLVDGVLNLQAYNFESCAHGRIEARIKQIEGPSHLCEKLVPGTIGCRLHIHL